MKKIERCNQLKEKYFTGTIQEKEMLELVEFFKEEIEAVKKEVREIIINDTLGQTFIKLDNETIRCFDKALLDIKLLEKDDQMDEFKAVLRKYLHEKMGIIN